MSGPTPEPGSTPEVGATPEPSPGSSGVGPVGPNASMADILARMQTLGTTPASAAPEAPPDAAATGPAAAPAGQPAVEPGGQPAPDGPVGWAYPPASVPPKRPRGRLIAGIAGIFAIVVGLGAKLLLGLAVAGVGSQVLGSIFGGPFEKLPQATRDGFEQRLNAALGPDAAKLSETDYANRYNALLIDGLPRLEDQPLVKELQYLAEMFDRADTATCAEAARSEFGSTASTFELSDKMWSQLSQDELTGHIDTQIRAIEASAAGSPPQRTVSDAEVSPAIDRIVGSLGDSTNGVLNDLQSGTTRTDDEACSAVRAFHAAEVALPPASLALVARYTGQP